MACVDKDVLQWLSNDLCVELIFENRTFRTCKESNDSITEDRYTDSWALSHLTGGLVDVPERMHVRWMRKFWEFVNNEVLYVEKKHLNGKGTEVHVVDDGINELHTLLVRKDGTSRVRTTFPINYYTRKPISNLTRSVTGHGTEVASSIGGDSTGLATETEFVSVKMCPDDESPKTVTLHYVASAIDLSFLEIYENQRRESSVINVSWGGVDNDVALCAAVYKYCNGLPNQTTADKSVTIVVAAGNAGVYIDEPVKGVDPINLPIIFVGAIDKNNEVIEVSNYGPGYRFTRQDTKYWWQEIQMDYTERPARHWPRDMSHQFCLG
ncbi:subtilisin-like protein [Ascobolus immersus RN42]|uniref:Subtilisin-like protein n=1 Tax=Ascobolus immersus RN42 TaxID=1160509 RepID=A0A3N4HVD4_ASCIM|nr:subtilisin-like protein [Ascobolus immersus RN42]